MKFRYFLTLIASVLVFAGCMQESIDSFESIKLDKTYLTIPETGGEVELTITATQDWNFVETEMWPRVIAYQKDSDGKEIKDEDGNKVIDESKTVPSWLTLKGEMSGKAGETKVVFAAEPTNGGREIELSIKAGNNVQYFRVRQGTMLASDATCAEVIAGVDGKSYRVQGVCTSIANDYYGNFYLNDGTGEIYIYGTKDGDGQYNWDDFNIEVGDSVKVEGPRKDYNGTIELVDALFIKVVKSLIKLVEPTDKMVDREGETFDVKLAYKGKGVFYTVADECSSWVKIEGMTSKSGEPTKLEPNPADTAIVTVTVAPFEELSSRAGSIEFSSSLDDAKSVITFAFRQGVEAKTAAEFNAMEKGNVPYKVTGCVREITNTLYGNMYVADHTGSVYVYGTLDAEGNSKNFESLGIEVGDIVSVVSPVDVYNNAAQMKNATVAEKIDVEAKTVEAFLATEENKTYYRLTGTVSGIADGDIYGNMTITDETGSVYVYGLLSGYGGEKKLFQDLVADTGLSNGDKLTLVGYHTSHNGKAQVGGAFYLLHEASSEGGEGGEEPAAPESKGKKTVEEFIAAADKENYYELTGTVSNFNSKFCSFDLTDASGSIYVYSVLDASKTEWVDKIKDGGTVTLYGKYDYYEKSSKHEVVDAHIVIFTEGTTGPETPGTKTERNLAFSAATASATLGQDFTAPTLSGETDGVAYSSSNTAVATVDAATGAVTLVAAGETTITATAEETETLQAGTASYVLTVSAAEPQLPAGISAIKAAATTAEASFNVNLNDAVVTCVSGSNAYIQDAEAGILIYMKDHGLSAGDKLTGEVSGKVKIYNNLREITEIDITNASKTQGAAIPVTELTLAELNADGAYDRYENMRIKISKAEMTGDLEISQNGQTYALYKKNSSVKGFDLYNIVDVIGYPGKYYENVQLNVFEDATVSGATKTVLSGFNNVELAVGDAKANKATASSGASVSYASASESIATVDENGTITGVAVGETTITASVEAYNGYPAATATCTVKVVAAGTEVEKAWTLVTDASTLAAGDKIIIVAKDANFAMSTTQNTNNRAQAAVTKSGNTLTFTSEVQEITLEAGTKTGTFAFNVGSSKYLYAASSSSNQLKTGSKNDNASWKIEIANTIATIKAQGTSTRNWLRYNSSNNPPIFSCYGSGQTDVVIYKYQ